MFPFRLHHKIPYIRRPFFQRDSAIAERDLARRGEASAIAERDAAARERDRAISSLANAGLSVSYPYNNLDGPLPTTPFARTKAINFNEDIELVRKIVVAYRLAIGAFEKDSSSYWDAVVQDRTAELHAVLLSEDFERIQVLLRDPGQTDLHYGFENLARSIPTGGKESEPHSVGVYLELLALATAIGVRRLKNFAMPATITALPSVSELLLELDYTLGFHIDFPNPFPGEIGLETSRGVASYRAVQALYQAWKISKLVSPGSRIAEIGAGLGRTCFYAYQLGFRDYTIIDIPMTAVAQANFLGRILGPDAVALHGEGGSGIRILPPDGFLNSTRTYDLIVNVDSLTEVGRTAAESYSKAISSRASALLSINHEGNEFTVRELFADLGFVPETRAPCWVRRGYVDELFRFEVARGPSAHAATRPSGHAAPRAR
jgi:SAM-dependent methyltransferase